MLDFEETPSLFDLSAMQNELEEKLGMSVSLAVTGMIQPAWESRIKPVSEADNGKQGWWKKFTESFEQWSETQWSGVWLFALARHCLETKVHRYDMIEVENCAL